MTLPDTDAWKGAPLMLDEGACPICQRESCDDPVHLQAVREGRMLDETDTLTTTAAFGNEAEDVPRLDPAWLEDAADVAAEGRRMAAEGIPYVVDGMLPDLGALGVLPAYAKTGKSTLGLALTRAVATGGDFLGRATEQRRVLVLAAEDPPEWTAYLARHLELPRGASTIIRKPLILDVATLQALTQTIQEGRYGLVLLWSWQHLVRGLVRDENDNAGAVQVAELVKAAARKSGVPWLVDAHSGKGEDQSDDADPTRAMRGASAVAGAADFVLSLRYAQAGTFSTQRRLSGRGRFVNLEPIVIDYDDAAGTYTVVGESSKGAAAASTWQLIQETGALTTAAQSAGAIARGAGLVPAGGEITNTHRRQIRDALRGRDGVVTTTNGRGTVYALEVSE